MKVFNCDCCGAPIFFENVRCLQCGSQLAFLPDRLEMATIEPVTDGDRDSYAGTLSQQGTLYRRTGSDGTAARYRLCLNQSRYQACNFTVRAEDANPLCVSCRQTHHLPDLSVPQHVQRWFLIEQAKRRLFYTLARLGLVATTGLGPDYRAPVYQFLADLPGQPRVMTGHDNGVITLNVVEADDDERARRRLALHEPYRTLLGHLRHESGHYYWDSLIRDAGRLDAFRGLFGDERADYGEALKLHYARDHSGNEWQREHMSAYATAHPWEDWAETWAHYLHMIDLLETASAYHTKVVVPGEGPRGADEVSNPFESTGTGFPELVEQWVPVTLMLNSLNRSLGQSDAYPFALSPGALRKLRFVHDVIREAASPTPEYTAVPAIHPEPPVTGPKAGADGGVPFAT